LVIGFLEHKMSNQGYEYSHAYQQPEQPMPEVQPPKQSGFRLPMWALILVAIVILVLIVVVFALYLRHRQQAKELENFNDQQQRRQYVAPPLQPPVQQPAQQKEAPKKEEKPDEPVVNERDKEKYESIESEAAAAKQGFESNVAPTNTHDYSNYL
jgi:cytoskeletal protein RodZ